MRIPRVRFTVRRLMFVVAIMALAISGEVTRRRWKSLSGAYNYNCTFRDFMHLDRPLCSSAGPT
jgi:hypothetical protein